MKILKVCPNIGSAFGQERVLIDSTKLLRSAGHTVMHLGATQSDPHFESDGIWLRPDLFAIHASSSPATIIKEAKWFNAKVGELRPDIVHLYNRFDPRVEKRFLNNFPIVFTEHFFSSTCPQGERMYQGVCQKSSGFRCYLHNKMTHCLERYRKKDQWVRVTHFGLLKRTGQKFSAVGAISDVVARMLKLSGISESKIVVVPNPITLQPVEATSEVFPQPLIVSASRLVTYKGVAVLVEAMTHLKNQSAQLWICGEGVEEGNLKEMISRFGLGARVKLLGRTSPQRTHQIISNAACLVAPNIGPEAFGLTVAETVLMGRPTIVSDLPALNEIVAGGREHLVFPAGNALALAEKIDAILVNPAPATEAVHRLAKTLRLKHSPEAHLEATLKLYELGLSR